jgi:hypothetical protein
MSKKKQSLHKHLYLSLINYTQGNYGDWRYSSTYFNLGTIQRQVVRFTPRQLLLPEKGPWYLLSRLPTTEESFISVMQKLIQFSSGNIETLSQAVTSIYAHEDHDHIGVQLLPLNKKKSPFCLHNISIFSYIGLTSSFR